MGLELKFKKLILKEAKYNSSVLGVNLLISRLQSKYEVKPTPEVLTDCLKEMQEFFEKYNKILAKDMEELSKI